MRNNSASLLHSLRQATRQAHLEVERHSLLAPLLSPDLDKESYARVLGVFQCYYCALEPGLDPTLALGGADQVTAYRYLPRAGLLTADLRDLGVYSTPSAPDSGRSPVGPRPEHTLGWLYVLEGATQGGRIIAPNVAQALGLDGHYGARYFGLYSAGQWRSFQRLLNQRQQSCRSDWVIEGALAAFDNLTAHLNASIRAEKD